MTTFQISSRLSLSRAKENIEDVASVLAKDGPEPPHAGGTEEW